MSIIKGYIVPHPPLIIPEIGEGLEKDIKLTINAYRKIAREISELKPDTIIISSPHVRASDDYFHLSLSEIASGTFERFHHPEISISVEYDTELIDDIISETSSLDFPVSTNGDKFNELDYATMIPLYFIKKYYQDFKVIRVGSNSLAPIEHYKFGQIVRKVVERKKKVVWVASGDLSHKLADDGPYGFVKEGPEYDEILTNAFKKADFYELLKIKQGLRNKAAECGLGSFLMMAGALDGYHVESKLISYEHPFGVGYSVASFEPTNYSDDREFAKKYKSRKDRQFRNRRLEEDDYVKLARESLEYYVNNHHELEIPKDLPKALLKDKAGVFVSLHIDNKLRGCIGTIYPTKNNIAEEIVQNAISSGSRDYRFNKVRPNELERMEYSVDVLKRSEKISSISELDIERYGVIVTSGNKTGLLLPNIDGIIDEEHQVQIAKRKAGINDSEDFTMERFEVIRHS